MKKKEVQQPTPLIVKKIIKKIIKRKMIKMKIKIHKIKNQKENIRIKFYVGLMW